MSVQYEFLNTVRRMKVTSEAATTLHKRLLPGETREVGLRATGSGVAVIEVGYQYNLNVTAAWPSFVVNPFVTKVRCSFTNRSVNAQKFSQYFWKTGMPSTRRGRSLSLNIVKTFVKLR